MAHPEFKDLPFDKRPDLTPYLIHLTRNTKAKNDRTAFDNLVKILKDGTIRGSSRNGSIKGPNRAACLMDVPFASLKYVFSNKNVGKNGPRYEPFGVFVSKKFAYKEGCRPVLYLSNGELKSLKIPDRELWRVVRLEVDNTGWISWLHEREWRCKGALELPKDPYGVVVRRTKDAQHLHDLIKDSPDDFAVKPRCIIPLEVICQGLLE